MAKISKATAAELESILISLDTAISFLDRPDVAVARATTNQATTTAHYTRHKDNRVLYEIDKEIGSDLACLRTARRRIKQMIDSSKQ